MGAKCSIGLSVFFFFFFCGLLIGLSCTIVRDYLQTANYKETKCNVQRSTYEHDQLEFWPNCNFDCEKVYDKDGIQSECLLSQFPCLQVIVSHFYDDQLIETTLHATPEQARKYPKCSVDVCYQDSKRNADFVKKWEKTYGQSGMTHVCYYNELDKEKREVVLDVPQTAATAIHALVWPSIGIFLSIIAFILTLVRAHLQRTREEKLRETSEGRRFKAKSSSTREKKMDPAEVAM